MNNKHIVLLKNGTFVELGSRAELGQYLLEIGLDSVHEVHEARLVRLRRIETIVFSLPTDEEVYYGN